MRSKCRGRVTPARLPWRALAAFVPRLRLRQSFSSMTIPQYPRAVHLPPCLSAGWRCRRRETTRILHSTRGPCKWPLPPLSTQTDPFTEQHKQHNLPSVACVERPQAATYPTLSLNNAPSLASMLCTGHREHAMCAAPAPRTNQHALPGLPNTLGAAHTVDVASEQ